MFLSCTLLATICSLQSNWTYILVHPACLPINNALLTPRASCFSPYAFYCPFCSYYFTSPIPGYDPFSCSYHLSEHGAASIFILITPSFGGFQPPCVDVVILLVCCYPCLFHQPFYIPSLPTKLFLHYPVRFITWILKYHFVSYFRNCYCLFLLEFKLSNLSEFEFGKLRSCLDCNFFKEKLLRFLWIYFPITFLPHIY